jgi:hypothetical protein
VYDQQSRPPLCRQAHNLLQVAAYLWVLIRGVDDFLPIRRILPERRGKYPATQIIIYEYRTWREAASR